MIPHSLDSLWCFDNGRAVNLTSLKDCCNYMGQAFFASSSLSGKKNEVLVVNVSWIDRELRNTRLEEYMKLKH